MEMKLESNGQKNLTLNTEAEIRAAAHSFQELGYAIAKGDYRYPESWWRRIFSNDRRLVRELKERSSAKFAEGAFLGLVANNLGSDRYGGRLSFDSDREITLLQAGAALLLEKEMQQDEDSTWDWSERYGTEYRPAIAQLATLEPIATDSLPTLKNRALVP